MQVCGLEFQVLGVALQLQQPVGACKRCQGFGNTIDYDLSLVVPDRSLSLADGAVDPWTKSQYSWYYAQCSLRKRAAKSA